MSALVLFADGQQLRPGKRLGKGGEGEVYALEGRAGQAVKIYTVTDIASREPKIVAMVRAGLAQSTPLVSFPSSIVTDSRGRFAGFLMKLVNGHQPIHHLYSTLDRKSYFPQADYRFLVAAATNVARALADVHARNCVIGDINHSGILVSEKATVALIDADSFQVTEGGQRFLCKVGVPEYTPPELQNQNLAGTYRTPNHDAFGLAVIVFQLLCLGRHPFVGSYSQGEMPIERAIAESRFAYSRQRAVGMKPPPGALQLGDFPSYIGDLLEAAFQSGITRPLAVQWVQALKRLEADLRRCATSNHHYFPAAAPECPWCRMEKSIGLMPFLPPMATGPQIAPTAGGVFNLNSAWIAIEAVRLPQATAPAPILPQLRLGPTQDAIAAGKKVAIQKGWGLAFSLSGLAVAFDGGGYIWIALIAGAIGLTKLFSSGSAGDPIRKNLASAQHNWTNAIADWERRCGAQEVFSTKAALSAAKIELEGLPEELRRRLADYRSRRRDYQLKTHLERYRIGDASIRGIGPNLKQALLSWGIDSAHDVTFHKVIRVDGIGEAKANSLVAWRQVAERAFRFDPNPNAADAREQDRINREIQDRDKQLTAKLSRGATDLRNATQRTLTLWKSSDPTLIRHHGSLAQAQANASAVDGGVFAQLTRIPAMFWALILIMPLLIFLFVTPAVKMSPTPTESPPNEITMATPPTQDPVPARSAERTDKCTGKGWLEDVGCRNPDIAQMDDQMSRVLAQLNSQLDPLTAQTLSQSQAEWFKVRDACRDDADPAACVRGSYKQRLAELDNLAAAGDSDDSVTANAASFEPTNSAPLIRAQALNASDWISSDDYPSRALRAGTEGRISVSLHVDARGRATNCTVIASTGSADLDETTCRLLLRRARYSPAQDASGQRVESDVQQSINWTIPR